MKHRKEWIMVLLAALALAAGLRCGGGTDDATDAGRCTSHAECPGGLCVDGRCVPLGTDADLDVPGADADVPGADADAPGADADAEVLPEVLPEVPPDTSLVDGDGDTIPDAIEGWDDPDGDTIPNAADDDSDGDDVPDALEAGDSDPTTMPADSDRDGTPDFLDLDSDNDAIRDADEWLTDVDGDTIPAYRDFDSDGDGIFDSLEAGDADPATPPRDSDGDGTPDYLDLDSDGDAISDAHESLVDTDGDTIMDYLDLDSDDDGVPDRDEAGDADLATPPTDCDGDTLPNFRDTDSDNDGLRDLDELSVHHTDPCLADTDGDTVTDLIEISYGSGATDPSDSPRTRGDFVFIVEYSPPPAPPIPPDPLRDTLSFATDLQKADVYFAIDTSGSMGGEISNLRSGLRSIVVPGVRARIPDSNFGAGRFEQCPGSSCTNAMNNVQDITSNITLVESAIGSMTNLCGGTEPYLDMLWLLATGNTGVYSTSDVRPRPRRCTDAATIGWPCFRPDAVKIIVQCGDETSTQSCAGRSVSTITAAMNAEHIKFIGIASGSSARVGFEAVANGTGSVDATTSRPLVFTIAADGTGLSTTVVDAVDQLARNVPIRVDAVPSDDPSDAVDAVAEFVDYMETNTSGATVMGRVCTAGLATTDGDGDGHPDYFPTVFPGTSVCWDIVPKSNVTVPATEDPQIFRAIIDVIGDGYTPLDQRDVFFLVPPVIPGSQ
ncbi:MAG: hypothetical protein JXB32_16910 [Deltaproteobacteria bacterium]|nr:hypothetical protein [Deltaproteobacteria bacterium]